MKLRIPTLIVLLAAALAGCSPPPPPAAAEKRVRVLKVGAGSTALQRTYSGEVRARIETTLGFRVPGKLIERLVDAGAVVKAGQPLARLDATDAGLQSIQAEAQRALAAADALRFRDLRAKNFVSQSALDARETALKAAEAQAALATNQAGYTTLKADRAGVIGQVLAEPGQVVAAGQGVFRLAPDGEREVAITIPENELGSFKLGQEAEVSLWSDERKPLGGVLREIAPVADPLTRTYAARISLKNADPRLPVGLTATVRFIAKTSAGGFTVPLAAIFQLGSQPAVWLVAADGSLSLKPVTVASFGDNGALISAGLAGGERIVAAGVNRLVVGEKVRVVEASQ
jgi:RND family efflux transporter MFP subunit